MKKIVFVSPGLSYNGIEILLVNILENINKEKYDVSIIVALDDGVVPVLGEKVRNFGVEIINICDLDSISKKIKYFRRLYTIFKQRKYDIVHSHMDFLNGMVMAVAKLAGIPKRICHAHNTQNQYNPSGKLRVIKSFVHKVYQTVMRGLMVNFSTEHLACAPEAGKFFYGKTKFDFIYNGINTEIFSKPNCADKNTHPIVTVARCNRQKNPIFAIEVIAKLKEIRTDFIYKWVGNGELLDATKQRAKELNILDVVEFTGARTDVPEILNKSQILFMPSLFEGLSVSLVEAQFAGLNCVTSDTVTKFANIGRTTFVSLDKSAEEWARVISDMLDKPVPALDEEKAKCFDIRYTVKQLEEIYDK